MRPVVLCILDGVGIREADNANAFTKANTPSFDYLMNRYPNSLLEASGRLVGLPEGQMGNSEVGHMNLGAGRIVYQALEKINKEIRDGEFFKNKEILKIIKKVKKENKPLHISGLLSDGGVHSHINHLFALLELAKKEDVKEVYVHAFLDGRDTLPNNGVIYLESLLNKMKEIGIGKLSTVVGRYFAMDRDNRYERILKAYDNLTIKSGIHTDDVLKTVENYYSKDITDEFMEPIFVNGGEVIKDNDLMICFNYRPDRLRELFSAFTNSKFNGFKKNEKLIIELVTMMPVSEEVICTNAFKLEVLDNTMGEYLATKGFTQLRIAETEKYAHVTYFFDGGFERNIKGCKRILIPSPKVATYDLKPEMSAYEITDTLLKELDKDIYDIVILNYANGDMVGHTGNFDATVKAVEAVDECLGKVYDKVNNKGGMMVVVSDHGNCDYMIDKDSNEVTSHSTSKVPFIVTKENIEVKDGKLADVAPTILKLLYTDIPDEMTGDILIK